MLDTTTSAAEGGTEVGRKAHDVDNIKAEVTKAVREMEAIDKERLSLNEDAGAIKAHLEKLGIPRSVFQAAYTFYKTDPDKRDGFDAAYSICREAMGLPVQGDLFKAKTGGDKKAADKVDPKATKH